MSPAPKTWVATAFVPFTPRRVNAIAALLIAGLRDIGCHTEWLRVPTDPCTPASGQSLAAAALLNLSGADNLVALEPPCFHLSAAKMSALVVRGGAPTPRVAERFDTVLAEIGAVVAWDHPRTALPPGSLTQSLLTREVVAEEGEGTLVVSLSPACDAAAADIASASTGSRVLAAHGDCADPHLLEERTWRSTCGAGPIGARDVHLVAPEGCARHFPGWAVHDAGARVALSILDAAGDPVAVPAPLGDYDGLAWAALAAELLR